MKNKICNISLFSGLLASVTNMPSVAFSAQWMDARAQRSYADAYNQVIMTQQQEYIAAQTIPTVQTASATEDLPVAVTDEKIADEIKNNKSETTVSDLESCSMIYPTGLFKWEVPQSGITASLKPQCVAVIELYDATTQKVLATTTLAAGDTMKCNIEMFPKDGWEQELNNVQLPLDTEPTMKDVEQELNKEQKENAGLKIAAAAIIGGLAGNMLGPKKDSDDDKLLGTNKEKVATTAIGAGAAAALMAASTYSGKVAGDTIKSTAVNATAGMIAGNMAAGLTSSESVLATTKCTVNNVEKDCVIGRFYTKGDNITASNKYYTTRGTTAYNCSTGKCSRIPNTLIDVVLTGNNDIKTQAKDDMNDGDWSRLTAHYIQSDGSIDTSKPDDNAEALYLVEFATTTTGASQPGFAVFGNLSTKVFGYKVSDWNDSLKKKEHSYYRRYVNDSEAGDEITGDIEFVPSARDAQDGSIIDLTNEARAKATMIGAAAGGALGGFSGYQGAQSELTERYLVAVNEYSLSLSNFACRTGSRFLGIYNSEIFIPSANALKANENKNANNQ